MTITYPIDAYYNRHDPTKNYEKHLVRAGYGIQSAEINEIQESQIERVRGIADVLFKDGDLVRDCQAIVDQDTGAVSMEGGALYLKGAVRGVIPKTFTIPIVGTVQIGIRLVSTVITELQDTTLRDPATGTRNYDEPGAGRLQVTATWGWDGDGGAGEFYAVYTVESGVLLAKEPPPAFDGITNAIAKYDRDSAGGSYIISGLNVSATLDRILNKLVILVAEGRARVSGYPIEVPRSLRLTYNADPDLKSVLGEPHTFTPDGLGKMVVPLDYGPLVNLQQVRITAERTVNITHGAFSGAKDPLPDTAVIALIEVKQGGTTYVQGTDYKLTSGQVDWSLAGAEPAPGSSYSVKYHYISTTAGTITAQGDDGFTLEGAVTGSVFTVDYTFALPRIDAIVLDPEGRITRIKGVASPYSPAAPIVPETLLKIASVSHNWRTNPKVVRDAVVVLPMNELQAMRGMVFDLFDLVAQERLRTDIGLSDPSAKRGLFVDPFNNDNLRDAGIVQDGAVIGGLLMLPIEPDVHAIGSSITSPELLPYTLEAIIDQPLRTGSMKINPYMAFQPVPGTMVLTPAVDFWTQVVTNWTSSVTSRFGNWSSTTTTDELVSVRTTLVEFLRPIEITFKIEGLGAGETIDSFTFDGLPITPVSV